MSFSNHPDGKISTLGLVIILVIACCCLAVLAAALIYPTLPSDFPIVFTQSTEIHSVTPKRYTIQPGATRTPTHLPLNTLIPNQHTPNSEDIDAINPSPTIQHNLRRGPANFSP